MIWKSLIWLVKELKLSLSRDVKVDTNETLTSLTRPELHLKRMLSKWMPLFSSNHYVYSSTMQLSVNHIEAKQVQVIAQYFSLVSIVHYRLLLGFKKWLVVSSGAWIWILFKGA